MLIFLKELSLVTQVLASVRLVVHDDRLGTAVADVGDSSGGSAESDRDVSQLRQDHNASIDGSLVGHSSQVSLDDVVTVHEGLLSA